MSRFVLMTFVALGVDLIILLPMTKISIGGYSASGGSGGELLNIVLQFIPTDIVSPFLNGNMLQIITVAVAFGLAILILGERASALTKIIDQIYAAVQLLMEAVGHLMPLVIFVSMLSFGLSETRAEVRDILQMTICVGGSFAVMCLIVYPVMLRLKYKIGYIRLMKKLLPTYIIAFTTASSSASFSSNIETCENSFGISDKITKFGVSLGQVVYMPVAAVEYFSFSVVMADMFDVEISIVWLITAIFMAFILSVATPPVSGGATTVLTVLFCSSVFRKSRFRLPSE